LTKARPIAELNGLVYGATEIPSEGDLPLHKRPIFWAIIVALVLIALNVIFW